MLLILPSFDRLQTNIELCSLKDFIQKAWPIVEPSTLLEWNWHLTVICDLLVKITAGDLKRLIINVPPGTGKSLIVSVMWPAWEWATDPGLRYLTASYTDHNTIRDNRKLRSIVTSSWYQSSFDLRLTEDQHAKIRFDTVQSGWRIATSVGGIGTGEHPDRIIVDDPHKAKEVPSRVSRNTVGDWMANTISTRIARNPATVIVMQRLHEDDLTARQLEKKGWAHLCLPMRYEVKGKWSCSCHGQPDKFDIRTKEGELLWPSLWPEEKVAQEELDLSIFGTSGQLQQRPVPPSGGIFKRSYFPVVNSIPVGRNTTITSCRGWDTAATEDAGDYTAGVRIDMVKDQVYAGQKPKISFYISHVAREQVEDADEVIMVTAKMDGKEVWVREETEPGGSGKTVIKSHLQMLAGYDFAGMPISGNKLARLRPFRAQAAGGNVFVVRGEWNKVYIDEMCALPFGKYDDQGDGTSCAFNSLMLDDDEGGKVDPTWTHLND